MFAIETSTGFKAFCLDQLEAAREQLEEEDPMRGRIAHILADNVAELIVHYQADISTASNGPKAHHVKQSNGYCQKR